MFICSSAASPGGVIRIPTATPPRVHRTASPRRRPPPAKRARQVPRATVRDNRVRWPAIGTVAAFSYSAAIRTLQCRRLLRQSALEELKNFPRTESPRQSDPNKSDHGGTAAAERGVNERERFTAFAQIWKEGKFALTLCDLPLGGAGFTAYELAEIQKEILFPLKKLMTVEIEDYK
ncbi:isoamylase 3, chloroplastic [Dorcoceras hygrometricum]|uniref:Isoamylase 3, chloroplastic n=1 Tax=Dorcoceras hygrometricum TaxID=472368 RepID=A0A2Z7AY74_9LAMI|nr:isoamylase 3, chloroplastic [Dorcoceras hygrometricum]